MGRIKYKPEKIIMMLREAEIEFSKGAKTSQVCRNLGISSNTFYRWRTPQGLQKA